MGIDTVHGNDSATVSTTGYGVISAHISTGIYPINLREIRTYKTLEKPHFWNLILIDSVPDYGRDADERQAGEQAARAQTPA